MKLLCNPLCGLNFWCVDIKDDNASVWVEDFTEVNRVLIPTKLARKVFEQIHGLAHTNGFRTLDLIPKLLVFTGAKHAAMFAFFSRVCLLPKSKSISSYCHASMAKLCST